MAPGPGWGYYYATLSPTGELTMHPFLAEAIGTMILVLLGDGVVANVVLQKTKGHNSGWLVITAGWAAAVTVAVYLVNSISGAHLNPAVTIALAAIGRLPWDQVPLYIGGQLLGAFVGAVLVWLAYLPHWAATDSAADKLGVFSTAPAVRHTGANFASEVIATFVLMLGLLAIMRPENLVPNTGFDKGFSPFLVGLLVASVGMSLGGSTGYAINPARDLGPRIAHAILPIPGKGPSDWGYAWIPVAGPIVGAVLGAMFFKLHW